MRPTRASASLWRGVALFSASIATSGCGLALGIDDIPPVEGRPDAGTDAAPGRDAVVADTKPDRPIVDAAPDRADRSIVDAAPDVLVGQLPKPGGPQTTSDAEVNFALHYLWLGETDQTTSFPPDPSAWETFGYNIDGKVTTSASTDVCTLAPTAPKRVQIDGDQGADNSFGENLVGYFAIAFGGAFSSTLSADITSGDYTVLFDTTGLTPSPTQTNVGLSTRIYGGTNFGGTPTFTLQDNWPVERSTLADGESLMNGAKISFSDSYVANGTWVSGEPTDIVFSLEFSNQPVALVFHQAVATFQHVTDDAGISHAKNGMIAGILKTSEFSGSIGSALGGIDHGSHCSLLGALQSTIISAQDIMEDGSNEAGEACTAISVGVAFDADEIQIPSIVGPPATNDAGLGVCPSDAGDAH